MHFVWVTVSGAFKTNNIHAEKIPTIFLLTGVLTWLQLELFMCEIFWDRMTKSFFVAINLLWILKSHLKASALTESVSANYL